MADESDSDTIQVDLEDDRLVFERVAAVQEAEE